MRNKVFIGIGIVVILLYMLPYLLLGENAYITIHDFLDSNIVHAYNVIWHDLIGDPKGMIPVMDGIPSLQYISLVPIDLKTYLYMFLPPYWAVVLLTFFVKVSAFVGMYFLLREYIFHRNGILSAAIALVFCFIPFYIDYSLSSAGVPICLYAVLSLYQKRRLMLSYLFLIVFAANSAFPLVGFFICLLWGLAIMVQWYVKKTFPWYQVCGLSIMVCIYVFANLSVLYNYLYPTGIASHREEFEFGISLRAKWDAFVSLVLYSQYHAGKMMAYPVIGLYMLICAKYYKKYQKVTYGLIVLTGLLCLIFMGMFLCFLPPKIFDSFQFDRFYFLYPSLVILLLAVSLDVLWKEGKKTIAVFLLILAIPVGISGDTEFKANCRAVLGHPSDQPSFGQFYDVESFSEVRKAISTPETPNPKIVCLGVYPAVAEYNGFHTIDSYVFSYPLAYKHKFRKIIQQELEKDASLKEYFDQWGSRCYLFSSELGKKYLHSKKENASVRHLQINTDKLKEMGCYYILSAVNIENSQELRLLELGTYTTDRSYYQIKVYKCL